MISQVKWLTAFLKASIPSIISQTTSISPGAVANVVNDVLEDVVTSPTCVLLRPDPIMDNGRRRNGTWGEWFDQGEALADVNNLCNNITTPITLSRAIGARPYYIFSKAVRNKVYPDPFHPQNKTTDYSLNFVISANQGCDIPLTAAYCSQQFQYISTVCPSLQQLIDNTTWMLGGMVNHTCGQFYMTAGTELTGFLYDFPLTDIAPNPVWREPK
jgi:hypothetical protein